MLPRLPVNRLGALDRAHKELQRACARHIGAPLDRESCRKIALTAHFLVEQETLSVDMLYQTLLQYEGRVLTNEWCDLVTRQIVARASELGMPLQLFERPIRDEWVALEVHNAEQCAWRDTSAGVLLTFYCLTGHPAGHRLSKKFPESWLAWLAYRIGYSRRLPYDYDYTQLIGLRIWAFLLRAQQGRTGLDFEEWKIDPRVKKTNQSILRKRMRFEVDLSRIPDSQLEDYTCPFEYEHYCSECQQTDNVCVASYHRGAI